MNLTSCLLLLTAAKPMRSKAKSPTAAQTASTLRMASVDDLIDSLCGKSDVEIRAQLSKLEKRIYEVTQFLD